MAKNRDGFTVLNTVNVKPGKLILTEKFRGRSKPVDDEAVIELANSIRSVGQQQPLQVRSVEGTDTYEVIFGNTRARAGQMIEAGYLDGKKEVKPDEDFTLRCEVVDATDEQAFTRNVVENAQRNATTPIDNAKNQEALRSQYAMSDAAIGRLYGYSGSAMVNRYKKLLTLPEYVQTAIHQGFCTASAGFLLADIAEKTTGFSDADYEAIWAKIKSDGDPEEGGIGQSQMANAIKEWRKEKAEAAKPATDTAPAADGSTGEASPAVSTEVKSIALTLKEYKTVLEQIGGDPRCPDKTGEFCRITLEVIAGNTSPREYVEWLMTSFGEEKKPEPAKMDESITNRDANNQPVEKKKKDKKPAKSAK